MTKKIYLFASVLLSAFYAAQDGNVGINTTQPSVTLEVVGQPANPNKLDGITAPRLTGSQLRSKTYTNLQNGAQVYVTIADPSPAGQTVNIIASGYYGTITIQISALS